MEPIFLGIDEVGPLFAVDMSHLDERVVAGRERTASSRNSMASQHSCSAATPPLLSHAAWLVRWRHHHRYCGVCGHVTGSREAGHVRVCTNDACRTLAFPRTDPAVIMVTEFADRCLLARQKNWPGGLHSCLAGFVEPGESAEEAVVREVREESGLEVRDVRYHATQPWPYPSSLMLGYFAVATHDAVVIDRDELAARPLVHPGGTRGAARRCRTAAPRFHCPLPDRCLDCRAIESDGGRVSMRNRP